MELTNVQKEDVRRSVLTAVRIVGRMAPEDSLSLDSRFSDIGFNNDQVKRVCGIVESNYLHVNLDLAGVYNSLNDSTELDSAMLAAYVEGYLAEGFDLNDSLYRARLNIQPIGASN